MSMIPQLVSAVVATLGELLRAGGVKGCEVLGESAARAAVDAIRKRLGSGSAHAALENWAAEPETTQRRTEFSNELLRALQEHPELAGELHRWLESLPLTSHSQTASASGRGTVIQIHGCGNTVGDWSQGG